MSTRPNAGPGHGSFLLVGFVVLVFLVLLPAPGAALPPADTTGVLRGQVVEQGTDRPLPGASIRVAAGPPPATERPSVTSDERGRFVLEGLPSGILELEVRLLGYETLRSPEIRITPGRAATVTLELRQRTVELEGLDVRVSRLARPDDAPLSTRRLSAEQVRRTAGGQTDISRTLLSLPGVLGGVDNRNDLLVRGGGPGENVYVVDGIRIPRINHFETQGVGGGALGLLNVEFIQDTDFHAGAFPARHGNALSSALIVRNRSGSEDRFRGDLTVGASEAGITLDGPVGDRGNVLFSLRRSYLQLLFRVLDLPIRPSYWDTQLRAEWEVDDRNRFVLLGLGSIDELDIVPPGADDPQGQEVANRVLDNDQWGYTTGIVWHHLRSRGVVRTSLSRSMERFRISGQGPDPESPLVSSDAWEAENRLRMDADLRVGARATLGVGGEVAAEAVRSDVVDAGGPGRPTPEPLAFRGTERFSTGAAWLQLSGPVWTSSDGRRRLTGSTGLRLDGHQRLAPAVAPSPRASLALEVTPEWELSLAGGRFLQAPPRAALGVEVEGEAVNRGLPFQEARHLVAGVAWQPGSTVRVAVEGFLKPYRSLPRSAADPSVVLQNEGADYGFSGLEPLVSDAEGRARGLELFVQRQGAGRWWGLLSYTLSRSEARGPDLPDGTEPRSWVPTSWDARHALDLTAGLRVGEGDRWEIGTRWRATTGRPFTPFDTELSPEAFRRTGEGVPDRSRLNSLRTPPYHRLDVRVDRRVGVAGFTGRVYLDIQNIYNRTNLFGFTWTEAEDVPDNLRPREQIGLLPTVGFTLEW
ncbi:MAG: TonB-dependent receptor [Gemmatimonadales bacterium]|nr:MAG: TonB-dependent receptor [Gemmatimonadales bacterium]